MTCLPPVKSFIHRTSWVSARVRESDRAAGYTDDIGNISWNVPTATLSFLSNMLGLPDHNWVNAIAMATSIAHKGAT